MSNSQYLSECLFSAACSKWQQLISLFCELETYLLQKTWYEKRASYRPHLIPSERLLCVPLFSLLYSLSCFPLFFHFFSLCLNWSLTRILMSWICEVHLDVQNDFLPSFFFFPTALPVPTALGGRWEKAGPITRAGGLSERHTHKQTHTHAKQSATSLFRRSNQDESLKRP